MKVILTFIMMIPIIIFSVLTYHYVSQILYYRNIKNTEINEALNLINEVEEIYALTVEDFCKLVQLKTSVNLFKRGNYLYIRT